MLEIKKKNSQIIYEQTLVTFTQSLLFFVFFQVKIWFQNKRSKFKKSQRKGSKRLAENEGDKCGASDEEEEGDELDGEEGEEEEEEGPLTDNDDSDNADKSDPDYSRRSDSGNVMRDGKGAPNKEQSDSGISGISGISGTCSPSLTASSASTTPPLALERSGSVQWASPPYYGGEYEGTGQQGESRYGHGFCGHLPLRLAQPLSASSPSYHGYQAAPHHYHFGGQYLQQYQQQQQQSLAYQQHGYGLGYARN